MSNISEVLATIFSRQRVEELPEDFSEIPSVKFFKEFLKRAKKDSKRSRLKITVHGDSDVESGQAFLDKLNDAYPELTGQQFLDIWSHLRFSLDYGVMGGDPWRPSILLNGGVLVRNHHRVVALSEKPIFYWTIPVNEFQRELRELQKYMGSKFEDEQENSFFYFSVLHRNEAGFSWSDEIPESLSSTGQTLIFIPTSWIQAIVDENLKSKFPTFAHPGFRAASKSSRSGHCVVRTFSNHIYGFSTFRASDEFDLILEEMTYNVDWGVTASSEISNWTINTGYYLSAVQERIREMPKQLESKYLRGPLALMMEDAFVVDYAKEKLNEINTFTPIFGSDHETPPCYWTRHDEDLLQLAKSKNGNIVAFRITSLPVKSFKNFEKTFLKNLEAFKPNIPNTKVSVYFPTNSFHFGEGSVIAELGSDECLEALKQLCKEHKKQFKDYQKKYWSDISPEELAQREEDHMLEPSEPWYFVVETDKSPDPVRIHQEALRMSTGVEGFITAMIPILGFNQGYSGGLEDTGNCHVFIPDDLESDDEDESEEEDFESDSEDEESED